ncbi:MAG: tRNA pseudouridine(38-40) synthase TruA [Deltaproteobacteria bacterium]|nr:tRNA pseudouridine(38-40) synthase TruA [Deltaproteobacteria bacterium]
MPRNIKLTLEYDGTNYCGWQIQVGLRTIQGEIRGVLRELTNEKNLTLTGVGRTDAGVHALNYVASFKTNSVVSVEGILMGLNSMLSKDIAVKKVSEVALDFDARRSALSKTYLYRLYKNKTRSALYRDRAWHFKWALDVPLMKKGAELFLGEKDFSTFCATGSNSKTFIRNITSFTVADVDGGFVEFEVQGKSFLRHMVRIMVGTLVQLGRGKISLADVERIIKACDRESAPFTAPSKGLFLKSVEY